MRARYEQIQGLAERSVSVPGDFAEFGVWQGTTFLPLAELAADVGKRCHAVDSFQGSAAPTERDLDEAGRQRYPAGALSVGGSRLFRQLVAPLGETVRAWEGWIPEVLDAVGSELEAVAFAHVDLDQYAPTLAALRWLWPRVSPDGIVCCHDWFRGRGCLAGGAIRDWMDEAGIEPSGTLPSAHIWFVR